MKVSVIIPTYNVEPYITECLESVARQTYQGEMECLIVDDCGTDNSIAVAKRFVQSYHGSISFKIIHRAKNGGLSAARNTGVEASTGDYIYFLDSDDAIIPETIEEMVNVVKEHPQVEMVQGGIANMKGKAVDDFTLKDLPDYTEDQTWITKNILYDLPVTSWNRLLKNSFLKQNDITFHEGIIHEDVPYCFQLALKCKYVGFVGKNTYLFRPQREGSITTTPQEERALQSRLIIMNDCITVFREQSFDGITIKEIALRFLWRKWQNYLSIHSYETLSKYKKELSGVTMRMRRITPWPLKAVATFHGIVPLRMRQYIKIK